MAIFSRSFCHWFWCFSLFLLPFPFKNEKKLISLPSVFSSSGYARSLLPSLELHWLLPCLSWSSSIENFSARDTNSFDFLELFWWFDHSDSACSSESRPSSICKKNSELLAIFSISLKDMDSVAQVLLSIIRGAFSQKISIFSFS